ncbi:MAG: hypothetical protein V5A88_01705 [Candidatus Thermoplasmatota archaeon]
MGIAVWEEIWVVSIIFFRDHYPSSTSDSESISDRHLGRKTRVNNIVAKSNSFHISST